MSFLLKEILLRHQKWEDDFDEKCSLTSASEGSQLCSESRAVAESPSSTLSTHTHNSDAVLGKTRQQDEAETLRDCRPPHSSHTRSAAQTQGTQQPRRKEAATSRYRTRPPGLRSAATESTSCDVRPTLSTAAATSTEATTTQRATGESCIPPLSTLSVPPPLSATLALPFTPYPVQQEMCAAISNVLKSSKPHVVPVAVTEVPTGCGKTMALLSSVLRYQQELKRMTPKEVNAFLSARQPPWQQRSQRQGKVGKTKRTETTAKRHSRAEANDVSGVSESARDTADDSDSEDGADAGWTVPRSFFKHFRVNSQRKIRAELDVTGSQELRRRFLPPPCTIYYVTRTHAQLRQAVRELRRLHGASSSIRMNILGSRERYCVHPKVVHAKANHTLPVEGNNLGEVCDKLVSMGLCEMVEHYDELSCSAIGGSIGHQRGLIWDMEDLVLEGSSRTMCPYYAARDLVFFADINFCTYPYLLDPLIRHETKMEAALKNNSVIVFDEAHNVAAVCQDALSLECPQSVLELILSELEPLMANHHTLARQGSSAMPRSSGSNGEGFATMQYPRELHLGAYTLVEIFSFLHAVFRSIDTFVKHSASTNALADPTRGHVDGDEGLSCRRGVKRQRGGGSEGEESGGYIQGHELEHHLRRDMENFTRALSSGGAGGIGSRAARSRVLKSPASASLDLFQRAYGVIMSLGVTFNPFLFTIFGLSMLKRWLLVLRFFFQKSQSFVLTVRCATEAEESELASTTSRGDAGHDGKRNQRYASGSGSGSGVAGAVAISRSVLEIRCLDGSLAFNHLLHSVHRVVLASGTLAPFPRLAEDLGLSAALWRTVEGLHVVPPTQYKLIALTSLPTPTTTSVAASPAIPLRCTYASLSDPIFLKAVARCVLRLAQSVQHGSGGGVLFFVPNYAVLHSLAKIVRELLLVHTTQEHTAHAGGRPIQLFIEPRKAEALTQVLHQFQCHTQGPRGGTALFFSVYRGKVSEGIDFTDDMARLVICLGVPLQPLKSWKVIAQRAYSGAEWYTTDAVRAVNQALGRCLRHVRDYGAVVLLDERYAQADYQQRLSRWCRASLELECSLPTLCERLQLAFTQWRHELSEMPALLGSTTVDAEEAYVGSVAPTASWSGPRRGLEVESQLSDTQTHSNDGAKGRLGTDQLPFQLVRRAPRHCAKPVTAIASVEVNTAESRGGKDLSPLLQSPFACTAVKLLYEASSSTSDVMRQDLHAAIALLAESFSANEEESNQEYDSSPQMLQL